MKLCYKHIKVVVPTYDYRILLPTKGVKFFFKFYTLYYLLFKFNVSVMYSWICVSII